MEKTLVELIRFYTLHSPFRKGKSRAMSLALRLSAGLPDETVVTIRDGRRVCVDLRGAPGMYETVYFLGEYERIITRIINALVKPGDVCLDIGANFGWYTTLLFRLCGTTGQVHAFEPVPEIFARLEKNIGLTEKATSVFINNLALGDKPGRARMHVFAGLPNGHSSLSAQGRADYFSVEVSVSTLDAYLNKHELNQVNIVKCDVEGAELQVLRGAQGLFRQAIPPIWIMEMSKGTSTSFGHLPNDLIVHMKAQADYEFYRIDELTGALMPFQSFAQEDPLHYRDRLASATRALASKHSL